ncbi:MAG: hypothetical protein WC622_12330 [Pedobacter sp.]|uniref:hypothetical protein n=1 Tax=Pedobacter sp. TaxID=1411316 RepID=UPI0035698F0D
MDIKLKELEQKNKQEQDNLKRIVETVAPITEDLLAPVYETSFSVAIPNYLQKRPISTAIAIFHPPKQA